MSEDPTALTLARPRELLDTVSAIARRRGRILHCDQARPALAHAASLVGGQPGVGAGDHAGADQVGVLVADDGAVEVTVDTGHVGRAFGKGGRGSDAEVGKAQSGAKLGTRNNANQASPPDGVAPWSNMYLWQPIARQAVVGFFDTPGRTVADFLKEGSIGHRSLVGSATEVADDLEHWVTSGAADGFVLMFDTLPTGVADVVDLVVPELQRRDLLRTSYDDDPRLGVRLGVR